MRRKVSAANWRFPLRMSRTQWARLPYRNRHAIIAQAMCTLLGHWRNCDNCAAGGRGGACSRIPAIGIASSKCRRRSRRRRGSSASRC